MIRIKSPRTVQQMQPLFKDFFIRIDHQLVINTHFPNSSQLPPPSESHVRGEDAIQKRRFTSAQIASENGNGN